MTEPFLKPLTLFSILFTSFGYFDDPADNETIKAENLKPNGHGSSTFNVHKVIENLITSR
jgi:hypothetical protein